MFGWSSSNLSSSSFLPFFPPESRVIRESENLSLLKRFTRDTTMIGFISRRNVYRLFAFPRIYLWGHGPNEEFRSVGSVSETISTARAFFYDQ